MKIRFRLSTIFVWVTAAAFALGWVYEAKKRREMEDRMIVELLQQEKRWLDCHAGTVATMMYFKDHGIDAEEWLQLKNEVARQMASDRVDSLEQQAAGIRARTQE